jgi:hypothetical protein
LAALDARKFIEAMWFDFFGGKKRRKEFHRFQQVTSEAFNFLISDYGYEHVSTEFPKDWEGFDECDVVFRHFPIQYHVTYTLSGNYVGSYFELFERAGSGWEGYDAFDLAFLIQLRCPDKEIKQNEERNTEEEVERIVRAHAKILKMYGGDLLRGDLSIVPEVKRVIEDEHRRNIESGAVFLHADGQPEDGDKNS